MAAHRYWRVINPEARGAGGLAISEFHLLDGTTRVDAGATLTSSVTPSSGSLADLKDDNTATGAEWSSSALRSLALNWDFGGSPQDVSDVRVGAADSSATMLYSMRLQSSDDAVTWAEELQVFSISYPGARTKTTSEQRGRWNPYDRGMPILADKSAVIFGSGSWARASTARSSGVLQFEMLPTAGSGMVGAGSVGVATAEAVMASGVGSDAVAGVGWGYQSGGPKASNGASSYGASWTNGDVIGVVVDFTAGTITFYKNGVSQGVAFSNLAGKTVYPAAGSTNASNTVMTIKPSGFTFPIAGASAWDTRLLIKSEVYGRGSFIAPATVVTAAGASSYNVRGIALPRTRRDMNWTMLGQGIGRLKGTTKDKGTPNVPVSERVRLYRQTDGLLMREVWSTAGTGAYSFDYIDELDTYYVISFDHDLNFRAVVADNLSLANGGVELMP